jgi:hypothetical protein
MTAQNPNIAQFAKTLDKDPSYVRRVCKRLNIEGSPDPRHPRSRLLSIEERAKLRDYFRDSSRTSPEVVPIEIITECSIVQDAPVLPVQIGLSQFRGDQPRPTTITDRAALVSGATAMIDTVIAALQSDTAAQQAELQATIAATQQLKDKAAELRDQALEYRILTKITAGQQDQAMQVLNAEVGKLQSLGVGTG